MTWLFILWALATWTLYELTFWRSSAYPNPIPQMLAIGSSIAVLAIIGAQLHSNLTKNETHRKEKSLLIIATFVLFSLLTSSAVVSAVNKAKVQWYIDDLESQGFDVYCYDRYPYNRGAVSHVDSYENFTSLAKDLNCTYVLIYPGAPNYFLFVFPSDTAFLINELGQYLLFISW